MSTDPLFVKENSQYYFYHTDHLGTPQKLTAVNGAVVWSAMYSAFGEAQVLPSSTVENNLRFPGQYFDAETGLHYNYHRFYDPSIGRYLRTDPIGLNGGINLFSYASINPINFSDPFGLYSWVDVPKAWNHYCDGTQIPWNTNFNDINWGDIHQRIKNKITGMVGSGTCQASTMLVNFTVGAQAAGADRFIIGRHTVNLDGQLTINCDCTWTFLGIMSSYLGYDPYNFNPSNRGPIGESTAWVGRNRCPNSGATFNIFISGSQPVSLSGP